MALSKAPNDQLPIPVFASGVMLVDHTVPKGVASARPPAMGVPPFAV
jgi:hypothetical protein